MCIRCIPSLTASATDDQRPRPKHLFSHRCRLPTMRLISARLLAALGRQKSLIAGIAGVSVILSGVYAFTSKPVWEGQFQIVLEQQDTGIGNRLSQLAATNPMLANLAGLGGGGGSQLETEVKVLESPSVLKPTYDFVKYNKTKYGKNVSNWSFRDWRTTTLRSNWKRAHQFSTLPTGIQTEILFSCDPKDLEATINATPAEIGPNRSAMVLPSQRSRLSSFATCSSLKPCFGFLLNHLWNFHERRIDQ